MAAPRAAKKDRTGGPLERTDGVLENTCGPLESACGLLESACSLLQDASPEALEQSAAILHTVTGELNAIRRAEARRISIEEIRRIRALAHKARFLLDSAARFHTRWQAILAGMTAGYGAAGAPAAIPGAGGRLRVSG